MKLLVVTHYYREHGGGVEIVAGELASRLAARGLDVRWAASGLDTMAVNGPVTRVPMAASNLVERAWGIPYPVLTPRAVLTLVNEVRHSDVVHIHDAFCMGNLLAAWSAQLFHKPLLVTQHIGLVPYRNWLPRTLMHLCLRLFTRHVLRRADRVVFISPRVLQFFARQVRFSWPPEWIANGVDKARFHPIAADRRRALRQELGFPDDRPVVLFVGRFVEKKGLGLLRHVAERVPECQWVFVGSGPQDPSAWGLGNVRCAGAVAHDAIACYYQAADILILPSVGEGFPLVVQEAMACGTPVIISADTAQALPDVCRVALACEPEVDALVGAVRQAVASPESLASLSTTARRFAMEHWDWGECANRYCELLSSLAGPGTRG
jgi:phosphatidylinositol alpha-1,6-mannosyltransferase